MSGKRIKRATLTRLVADYQSGELTNRHHGERYRLPQNTVNVKITTGGKVFAGGHYCLTDMLYPEHDAEEARNHYLLYGPEFAGKPFSEVDRRVALDIPSVYLPFSCPVGTVVAGFLPDVFGDYVYCFTPYDKDHPDKPYHRFAAPKKTDTGAVAALNGSYLDAYSSTNVTFNNYLVGAHGGPYEVIACSKLSGKAQRYFCLMRPASPTIKFASSEISGKDMETQADDPDSIIANLMPVLLNTCADRRYYCDAPLGSIKDMRRGTRLLIANDMAAARHVIVTAECF